jgi:probable F420-dependent oxidoreductase
MGESLAFYLIHQFESMTASAQLAAAAEKLGFGGLAVGDHLFYSVEPSTPYPYTEDGKPRFALDRPWPDVFVLFGALGQVTSTLRFRTNVYVLPLRHPLVVARAAGTAQVVTGGRVELGVGVGHLRDEFDALGVDFHTRGRRTDEAMMALRALLRPGPVSYRGSLFDIPPIYLHPAPEQPVPLFVGGESKAALARTARLADGYVSIPHSMDELESLMAEMTRLRAELAPELPPLRFHVHATDVQTVHDYRRLADAGAEAVNVAFWRTGRETYPLEQELERMQEFSDSIITRV